MRRRENCGPRIASNLDSDDETECKPINLIGVAQGKFFLNFHSFIFFLFENLILVQIER